MSKPTEIGGLSPGSADCSIPNNAIDCYNAPQTVDELAKAMGYRRMLLDFSFEDGDCVVH
ncbi:hypothetical protein [Cerasicoccus frondis]|uniref:hypothetical protein n=1 Tax=Cerasicoccus frondis TaxID=490090 RepID=UPI002852C411|nr:hypothetical protein [Cerasicoccus frondis]